MVHRRAGDLWKDKPLTHWMIVRRAAVTLCAGVVLAGGTAAHAAAKPAPKPAAVNPAPYIRQLGLIGGNLRDIQATLDVRMGERGEKPMTFKLNVAFRMPDSVRMDVLSSSNGMFRGWKFARVGPKVQLYDPISERATSTDLARLTGRQPIRMDIGVDMFAGIFRPNNYRVASAAPAPLNGKKTVLLKLIPKPGFNDPKSVIKLSHILVWMDPARKVPLRQESYGWPNFRSATGKVMRLITGDYVSFKPGGGGVWYPDLIRMTRQRAGGRDDAPANVQLKLARLNGVLVPTEITASGGHGASLMRYSNIRVNAGLPASTFNPR